MSNGTEYTVLNGLQHFKSYEYRTPTERDLESLQDLNSWEDKDIEFLTDKKRSELVNDKQELTLSPLEWRCLLFEAGIVKRGDIFPVTDKNEAIAKQIITYIQKLDTEKFSQIGINEICNTFPFSPQTLRRRLQKSSYRGWREIKDREHMRRAEIALASNPDITVEELSWQAGFQDSKEISRKISKSLGLTISKWKEKVIKK